MKNTNYTIYLKTDKTNSKGETNIYCKVTCFGLTSKTFSFGHSIKADRWTKTNRLSKANITEAESKIKIDIEKKIHKMTKIVDKWEDDDKTYTAEMLLNELFKVNENRHKTVLDAFELHKAEFMEDVENGLKKKDAYKKYNQVKAYVISFLELKKQKDKLLDDLDDLFHKQFHKHLQSAKHKDGKPKLGINQVTKYLYLFRHVIKRAVENKWLTEYPFIDRQLETIPTNPTFLTEEEVRIISEMQFENRRLENTKNIFLFGILTGYSWCEIFRLKHSDIQKHDDQYFIFTKRNKTNVAENVPLTEEALHLIDMYRDDAECLGGKLFPTKVNKCMNESLKIVGELSGISKNLTCHVSRHTFATVAINRGMDLKVIQKLLGQKDARMTAHYAHILKERQASQMQLMQGVLKVA